MHLIQRGADAVDRFFHEGYGAARSGFFRRVFLTLLAFDAFRLMVRAGARYGVTDFQVAHFAWMDRVQPFPTAGLHVAVVLLTGLLSLTLALTKFHRGGMLALFFLYTYSWSMSMLDGYQHHYFLSLVLFCMVGFSAEASASPGVGAESRLTGGWGFPLLGVTVAVLYFFTAIAKMDHAWVAGEILPTIGGAERALGWLANGAVSLGIERHRFWGWASTGVVAQELLIGATYLAAVHQDRPEARVRRLVCGVGFGAAVTLHLMAEAMDLRIGLFSYYMLTLAGSFLLPLPVWSRVTSVFTRLRPVGGNLTPIRSSRLLSLAAVPAVRTGTAATMLVVVGWRLDLPGAWSACLVAALALVLGLARAWARGAAERANPWSGAALVATLGMWLAITTTSARFDFYRARGSALAQVHRQEEAVAAFRKAERYAPMGSATIPVATDSAGP